MPKVSSRFLFTGSGALLGVSKDPGEMLGSSAAGLYRGVCGEVPCFGCHGEYCLA